MTLKRLLDGYKHEAETYHLLAQLHVQKVMNDCNCNHIGKWYNYLLSCCSFTVAAATAAAAAQ